MTDAKKPYISASQLGMYERCGEQYRRRYIEKERIPPGVALLKGTGVHGGARVNFRQKVETHEDLPKKDIVEISVTEFERSYQNQGVLLTAEEESIGLQKVMGETKDSVVTLSGLFADEVAPVYQPAFVEESYRITIPRPNTISWPSWTWPTNRKGLSISRQPGNRRPSAMWIPQSN